MDRIDAAYDELYLVTIALADREPGELALPLESIDDVRARLTARYDAAEAALLELDGRQPRGVLLDALHPSYGCAWVPG